MYTDCFFGDTQQNMLNSSQSKSLFCMRYNRFAHVLDNADGDFMFIGMAFFGCCYRRFNQLAFAIQTMFTAFITFAAHLKPHSLRARLSPLKRSSPLSILNISKPFNIHLSQLISHAFQPILPLLRMFCFRRQGILYKR